MDSISALKAHLTAFPLWNGQSLLIDEKTGKPGFCTLQPLGIRVIARREDVQGNVRYVLRQSFLLRRAELVTQEAAQWLLALQDFLRQPADGLRDAFGSGLRLWAEDGRMVNQKQPGTGIYEVKIHAQYEKE